MSLPDRIFRTVLRILPAEFRGDYERELASTFHAERRSAAGLSLARLWFATIADVCRTAPAEHLDILTRDLRYAARMLARRPALALTSTLTLAVGIGANTAIFSIVHGVLLSSLPYPDPDRLVMVREDKADGAPGTTGYYSFNALRSEQQTLDGIAAMSGWSAVLTGGSDDAERISGARVTWEFFRTLGVAPAIGRDFDRAEDHPDRRRVVILSDGLWRRRFGADRSVVGRVVTINDVAYTVAGVMPPSLRELVTTRTFPDTQIWTLLGYPAEQPPACRTCRHIFMLGRLKNGVSVQQAEADLTRVYQSLGSRFPSDYSKPSAVVTPIRDYFLGPVKPVLLILWGAVGLLLLMTCANIANLLLIRASERDEEIAIRRAMGVSPARMLRQLLTESTLLAIIGGTAGALLAWWGTAAVAQHGPAAIPRIAETTVNWQVLFYALVVTVATGLLFGLAPARLLIGRRQIDHGGLMQGGQRTTAGPGAWRYRASLIAVNVAVLATLVAELRDVLGDSAKAARFVRTAHRFGYAFCGEASALGDESPARDAGVFCWLIRDGRRVPLGPGKHVIGRDPGADIMIDSVTVSRHHARIVIDDARAVLEDLESKNGTFLDGTIVSQPTDLKNGAVIRTGSIVFRFRMASARGTTATWTTD